MKIIAIILLFIIAFSVSLSACTIVFDDTRGWPLGVDPTDYDSLKSYLTDLGRSCITLSGSFSMPECDVFVIRFGDTSSIYNFTDSEILAIQDFVYKGGTLVAIAEHGLSYVSPYSSEVNRILSDSVGWHTGLRFRRDAIFDTVHYHMFASAPKIFLFDDHPYILGLDTVELDLTSSISVAHSARPLMWSSPSSFALDSSLTDTCITCRECFAHSHFGLGNILAIPDFTMWRYSSPTAGLNACDNRQFAANVLNCSIPPKFRFMPPFNGVVSCFERDTLWWEVFVANYGAIDTSILAISLNGIRLDPGPSFVILDDTSFAVCITDYITLTHGDSVWICIDSIADVDSFFPFDSFCYPIVVDHMPPTISAIYPSPDTSLDWFDSISVWIIDSIAGLDTTNLVFVVNGDTFYIDDPQVTFIDGRLTLHLDAADSLFMEDSLVAVSLYCCDMPDVCEPNCYEYSWGFISRNVGIAEVPFPSEFSISAYPNPFNSTVTISLSVIPGLIRNPGIEIFDINGRMVAEIPANNPVGATRWVARAGQPPVDPYGTVVWTPNESLGSGVYLVRAKVDGCALTARLVYLK